MNLSYYPSIILVYLLFSYLLVSCFYFASYLLDDRVDLRLFFLAGASWHTMFAIMPKCYNLVVWLKCIHYLYELAQMESDNTISLC